MQQIVIRLPGRYEIKFRYIAHCGPCPNDPQKWSRVPYGTTVTRRQAIGVTRPRVSQKCHPDRAAVHVKCSGLTTFDLPVSVAKTDRYPENPDCHICPCDGEPVEDHCSLLSRVLSGTSISQRLYYIALILQNEETGLTG
jgi:hypothetical protein